MFMFITLRKVNNGMRSLPIKSQKEDRFVCPIEFSMLKELVTGPMTILGYFSTSTKPIEFSLLEKFDIDLGMVLCIFLQPLFVLVLLYKVVRFLFVF